MNFLRLYHTLRYLKPVQFYGRAWFRLFKPKVNTHCHLSFKGMKGAWLDPVRKTISMTGAQSFCFLNQEHELTSAAGWNHPQWEKLWLYNLHYFDDLVGENGESRKLWHVDILEKWISENPVGQGNGWEPYPTSLRIVNWIKWSLAGNQLSQNALQSLEVQARYLRKRLEIHLLGNHLLANAKALVFAGLFFQGKEAAAWLNKGLEIFAKELPEQILLDGGHFERSPMYHAIILDDLLDLINVSSAYEQKLPDFFVETAERMLFWLHGMIHPDGGFAFFNDTTFGIAPRPVSLFEYAERLGLNCEWRRYPLENLNHFAQTGYLRWQTGDAVAFLDVAPIGPDYLPGHAHADTLSFEFSLYGQRLFVNSGISCYGDSAERLYQRSTVAHNTVEVDGENSSEIWGGFRVARRARPKNLTITHQGEVLSVGCAHDGYERLSGHVTHYRQWDFNLSDLVITDTLSGEFDCAKAHFYLHPEVSVHRVENSRFVARLATGQEINIFFSGAGIVDLEDTSWHPGFGVSIKNKCLAVNLTDSRLITTINW